jgi:uncharacterized protein YlxP (DUF503 family)
VVVGSLEVHLRLEGCRSLKDKRSVLRPVIERLRRDLHLSVAEVADNDLWNVATIGVACVGTSRAQVELVLERAECAVSGCAEARIESVVREVG